MDPEQTFLRVHARLSGMLSQLLTPRIRLALEHLYLAVAVALFCLLVIMHTNFVQQPGCSSELSAIEFTEAELIQIKIVGAGLWAKNTDQQNVLNFLKHERSFGSYKTPDVNGDEIKDLSAKFWSNLLGLSGKRSKLIFKPWKSEKDFLEPQVVNFAESAAIKSVSDETDDADVLNERIPTSLRESLKAAVLHLFTHWRRHISSFWKNVKHFSANASELLKTAGWHAFDDMPKRINMFQMDNLKSFLVRWLEKRSKTFEPTYLYTVEKGYFLLPEAAKVRHNLRTVNITISAQNACFGNRWQQLLINSFVGYDTILMNSLLNSPGQGYLYNYQTKEFYDLSYGREPSSGPAKFGDYFVTKCGVLILSLFVFFTTTMSVSFTLRETQSRMLKFTVQLQHHARHRLPTFQLIFVHVIESLVFVPIMIGILFFLFEFYDDQLLAFLVLTLVWLCELFTLISVRTPISMQFFPRFFLLYFLVFHIYFFSYAHGFSYLAFSTTAAFMQHLILYFWNRFEVPALQRYMRTRAQLQQQTGVQITSSTIYTSTVHIARVNVQNTNEDNVIEREPDSETNGNPLPGAVGSAESNGTEEQTANGPDSANNSTEFTDMNPQQPVTDRSPGPLNPFSSLLLWILGGASSDGLVSLFSMFRDPQEPGQDFTEQPSEHENETRT